MVPEVNSSFLESVVEPTTISTHNSEVLRGQEIFQNDSTDRQKMIQEMVATLGCPAEVQHVCHYLDQ
jgi:hypothetical protein